MSLTNIDCAIGMADLPDESIDVIFTDPPYVGDQYEAAYQVLADHAARLLKPSGFLATYAGQYHLDRVMQILGGGGALLVLDDRADPHRIGVDHPSAQDRVLLEANPDLSEAPGGAATEADLRCFGREWRFKRHPWEQGLETTIRVLSKLAGPGAVILDPFVGTGTNLLGVKLLGEGRRYIGFEIDPATFAMAVSRLEQEPLAGRAIAEVCE